MVFRLFIEGSVNPIPPGVLVLGDLATVIEKKNAV